MPRVKRSMIAGLFAIASAWSVGQAHAQAPTASDIALCNQEAQTRTGEASASPGLGGPRASAPDAGRDARPPAPDAKSPDRDATDAPTITPRDAPSVTPMPGMRTDPSGSIITRAPDPLIEGMATEGLDDPAYRAVYRDCMAERRHRGR